MLASGGFEVFVFPVSFRSLMIRVSFGWNFMEPDISFGGNQEIYFGLDFHY
jgi:hypothetical protein